MMLIIPTIIFFILILFLKLKSTKIKGSIGELKVNTVLKFLNSEYISLHNVMLKNAKGFTSQIDHLVLSEYGIFVIETKNYKGWIFGNENAENWMQIIFNEKHSFRNPVKQNWSHVYALKELLSDFPYIRYFPIVVFSGKASLKDIKSSVPVIYESSLKRTIKNLSIEKCLTSELIERIKKIIESSEITEKNRNKEHIQNIRHTITMRQIKMENLICPRCNGELKLRKGRNGKFYGCSNYPKCRFTMSY